MPVIANNTAANSALVYLNRNSAQQDKSLNKISSGSRIVTASDDAAGLAVGSSLRADVAAYKQAATNVQQANALLKVADAGLSGIGEILQRMSTLAAQAMSGSVDTTARGFINTEFVALRTEVDNIANNTRFNGQALIDGSYTAALGTFLVGAISTDTIAANLSTVDGNIAALNINASVVTGANTTNAAAAFTAVGTAIDTISTARATVGSFMSRFEYRGDYIAGAVESQSAAVSAIMDVDLASEQTTLVSKQVLTEASIAALSQANQMKSSLLSLVR
jgi:flagellin